MLGMKQVTCLISTKMSSGIFTKETEDYINSKIQEAEREVENAPWTSQLHPTSKDDLHTVKQEIRQVVSQTQDVDLKKVQEDIKWPAQAKYRQAAAACLHSVDQWMKLEPWQHSAPMQQLNSELSTMKEYEKQKREEDIARVPSEASKNDHNIIFKASSFISGGGVPPS